MTVPPAIVALILMGVMLVVSVLMLDLLWRSASYARREELRVTPVAPARYFADRFGRRYWRHRLGAFALVGALGAIHYADGPFSIGDPVKASLVFTFAQRTVLPGCALVAFGVSFFMGVLILRAGGEGAIMQRWGAFISLGSLLSFVVSLVLLGLLALTQHADILVFIEHGADTTFYGPGGYAIPFRAGSVSMAPLSTGALLTALAMIALSRRIRASSRFLGESAVPPPA